MPIPYITLSDPRAAMALYEKALGAKTTLVMDGPGGNIMHAEMNIDGERFMLGGVWPGMSEAPSGRSPVNFMLYVDNADESLQRALEAGMTLVSDAQDMFWGDRMAKAFDGHGYEWSFAHHIEELTDEEVRMRAAEFAVSMGGE